MTEGWSRFPTPDTQLGAQKPQPAPTEPELGVNPSRHQGQAPGISGWDSLPGKCVQSLILPLLEPTFPSCLSLNPSTLSRKGTAPKGHVVRDKTHPQVLGMSLEDNQGGSHWFESLGCCPLLGPTLVTLILPSPFKKSMKKMSWQLCHTTLRDSGSQGTPAEDPRGTNPRSCRALASPAAPCSSPQAGRRQQ